MNSIVPAILIISKMLAIQIQSIVPNSMADERTMSTFTWFNSALRNNQDLGTLVGMAQVRQFHKMVSNWHLGQWNYLPTKHRLIMRKLKRAGDADR